MAFTPAIVSRRLTAGVVDHRHADLTVEHREVLAQPVQLAQVPVDGGPLVIGQDLLGEPGPPRPVEQLRVRTRRDEVRRQDGVDLVLHPRAMADHLVAARHQPTQALGLRIGHPHLGQEISRAKRGQHAGVDLVGLDPGVRDRLHLQRVGDDHPRHVRGQHPHHRHGVAGGLDHHLVVLGQAAAEALQP